MDDIRGHRPRDRRRAGRRSSSRLRSEAGVQARDRGRQSHPEAARARAWIDEADRQLVRLEARLLENLGGRSGPGSRAFRRGRSAFFQRRKINDEIWLPTEARFTGGPRPSCSSAARLDVHVPYLATTRSSPSAPRKRSRPRPRSRLRRRGLATGSQPRVFERADRRELLEQREPVERDDGQLLARDAVMPVGPRAPGRRRPTPGSAPRPAELHGRGLVLAELRGRERDRLVPPRRRTPSPWARSARSSSSRRTPSIEELAVEPQLEGHRRHLARVEADGLGNELRQASAVVSRRRAGASAASPASGPESARPVAGDQYVPVSLSRRTSMSRQSAPEFSKVRVRPATRRSSTAEKSVSAQRATT